MKQYTVRDTLFAIFDLLAGPVDGQHLKADYVNNYLPACGTSISLDDPVSEEEHNATVAKFSSEMRVYRQRLLSESGAPPDLDAFWSEQAKKTDSN